MSNKTGIHMSSITTNTSIELEPKSTNGQSSLLAWNDALAIFLISLFTIPCAFRRMYKLYTAKIPSVQSSEETSQPIAASVVSNTKARYCPPCPDSDKRIKSLSRAGLFGSPTPTPHIHDPDVSAPIPTTASLKTCKYFTNIVSSPIRSKAGRCNPVRCVVILSLLLARSFGGGVMASDAPAWANVHVGSIRVQWSGGRLYAPLGTFLITYYLSAGAIFEESTISSHHHAEDPAASAPSAGNPATPAPAPACLAAAACPSASESTTSRAAVRWTGAEADAEPPVCFVCMDAAADAVLIECGHGGLCAGALPTHSLKPACRIKSILLSDLSLFARRKPLLRRSFILPHSRSLGRGPHRVSHSVCENV
jgi:hypothetical protein